MPIKYILAQYSGSNLVNERPGFSPPSSRSWHQVNGSSSETGFLGGQVPSWAAFAAVNRRQPNYKPIPIAALTGSQYR